MQHGRFFMSKVWEFFENMNEAVYASDVDTYELLYLNKAARDLFQFKDESDYKAMFFPLCHVHQQPLKTRCVL